MPICFGDISAYHWLVPPARADTSGLDILNYLLTLNFRSSSRGLILPWLLTAEAIWRARNRVCFAACRPDMDQIVDSTRAFISCYGKTLNLLSSNSNPFVMHSIEETLMGFPDHDIYTVDASFLTWSVSAWATIYWNAHSCPTLAVSGNFWAHSAQFAELMAILKAVEYIAHSNSGLPFVILSDCLAVVMAVNANNFHFVDDGCRALCEKLVTVITNAGCKLFWIHRSLNSFAHNVAKATAYSTPPFRCNI